MSDEESEGPGLSIEAVFKLAARIGDGIDTLDAGQQKMLRALSRKAPIFSRPTVSGFVPDVIDDVTPPLVLDLGTPSQGFYWEVRQVVVGAAKVTTSVAGEAGLFVAGSAQIGADNINNCVDIAVSGSLPSVAYYPSGSLYVRSLEHLFLVVYDGSGGTPAVVNVQAHVLADVAPTLPLTIVDATNDTFIFTGDGGGGTPETFTIAPGTYTTLAELVAAVGLATGSVSGEHFSTKVTPSADSTKILLTANGVTGTADNGDTITEGDGGAAAIGFTADPDTFAGGVSAASEVPGQQLGANALVRVYEDNANEAFNA